MLESGFGVERRLESGNFVLVQELSANTTTFIDQDLTYGLKYYYRVKALGTTNESQYSNEASCWLVRTFVKTFGGNGQDEGNAVNETADGGYIITGYTGSYGAGGKDIWLIKTDMYGDEDWSYTFGTNNDDIGYSVQETRDNGYVICGRNGNSGLWIIKTNSNGNKEWDSTIGTNSISVGYSIQQVNDDGYIITGSKYTGQSNLWLIKTDMNGITEWDHSFESGSISFGRSVQQTLDGGYIIGGGTRQGDDYFSWLVKTDSDGRENWNAVFDETSGWVESIRKTTDGGYILVGNTPRRYGAMPWDYEDFFLIKTHNDGNKEFQRIFGGNGRDGGFSIDETSDGGYVVVGETWSYGLAASSVWLIKTDSNGIDEWNQTFGEDPTSVQCGYYVDKTKDGGYIVAGFTSGADRDVLLIKTDPEGNVYE